MRQAGSARCLDTPRSKARHLCLSPPTDVRSTIADRHEVQTKERRKEGKRQRERKKRRNEKTGERERERK